MRRIKIKSAQGQESRGQSSDDVDRRDEVPPRGKRSRIRNVISGPFVSGLRDTRSEGLLMTPSGAQRCSGVQVLTGRASALLLLHHRKVRYKLRERAAPEEMKPSLRWVVL